MIPCYDSLVETTVIYSRTVPYKNIFEDILFAEEFDVCSNDVRIRTQFTVK